MRLYFILNPSFLIKDFCHALQIAERPQRAVMGGCRAPLESKRKDGIKGVPVQNAAAFFRCDRFTGKRFKGIDRYKERRAVCVGRHQKRPAAFSAAFRAQASVTAEKNRVAPVPAHGLQKRIERMWGVLQDRSPPVKKV